MTTIYVGFDTETTGVQVRKPENVIMISMVAEKVGGPGDTSNIPVWLLPSYTVLVDQKRFEGEAFALWLNSWIFSIIADANKGRPTRYAVLTLEQAMDGALEFLKAQAGPGKAIPVGQNVGTFDLLFLTGEVKNYFNRRVLEIGSVFYDPSTGPRTLSQVKESLGFDKVVSHNAYHEAMDYILALRTKHGGDLTPYPKES